MKRSIIITYIIGLLFFSISVNAQPTGGDPNGGTKPGDVPIGGVELLLIAGAAFGIKKLYNKKEK